MTFLWNGGGKVLTGVIGFLKTRSLFFHQISFTEIIVIEFNRPFYDELVLYTIQY